MFKKKEKGKWLIQHPGFKIRVLIVKSRASCLSPREI